MNILLIEAGNIDADWLQNYVDRYATDVTVRGVRSLGEAERVVRETPNTVDIMLLDTGVPDALSPTGIVNLVMAAPWVPIVIIVTGKTLHYECVRTPETRVYHLKTDVSRDTFLQHLRNIVAECQREHALRLDPPGPAHE